jgi:gluconokinase
MVVVIIIMGAAGAGKTTVGRALAAALGWPFVDADDQHPARNIEKMRAGVPLTHTDRAPWIATLRAMVERAIDRREHTVLACSALKERDRHTLRGHLRPVRFVHLRAARDLLEQRVAARPSHFFGPALVSSQLADLEEPADALIVDAAWPLEQMLTAIRHEFGV